MFLDCLGYCCCHLYLSLNLPPVISLLSSENLVTSSGLVKISAGLWVPRILMQDTCLESMNC